ncbi:MAG: hypothetical protein LC804_11550 [Acidobacteria bacterium]|nr:hypothetical protein [Acidobacteriota bacterium]
MFPTRVPRLSFARVCRLHATVAAMLCGAMAAAPSARATGRASLAAVAPPSSPAPQPRPGTSHVSEPQVADGHATEEQHAEGILPTAARLFNFAVLTGTLVYLLRKPIGAYLQSRATQIRSALVTARSLTDQATRQLAEIDDRLKGLPAEIEALKTRGAQEVAAEEARIRQAADAERQRLLYQMRREIDLQVRVAKRDVTREAGELAVAIAEDRIRRTITSEDQVRLIDRYAAQMRKE